MKFPKSVLIELADDDAPEGYRVISNEVYDTSRWSIHYSMLFEHDGKVWATSYSRGATESQDESPYEYEGDDIECEQMEAYETTVTAYRPVKA